MEKGVLSNMVRLIYVILASLPFVLFYLAKSHYVIEHIDNYSEQEVYSMVQRMIQIMKHNGKIETDVFGKENLPKEGGYVMYPNHQGKYDALGIINAHDTPCTFLIDEKRSGLPFAHQFADMLKASRLDKTDIRSALVTINEIAKQVKEGRRYIVFPEGGYVDNSNKMEQFKPGAFKCSVRSKTPIVPVALIDSYRVFGINSLKKVKTQVHFLPPIYYEEYESMSTVEIAEMVKNRIEQTIASND